MKNKLLLFITCAIASALYTSCDKEKDEEQYKYIGTPSIEASTEVKAFFDGQATSLFANENENQCFTINSAEELAELIPSAELPEIDYEKYTLIVGQYSLTAGQNLESPNILYTESGDVELVLNVRKLGGVNPAEIRMQYYWGLYPKFPNDIVNVRVYYINEI